MNQDWQAYLTTQGAHIAEGVVQDFGDAAAERLATRDGSVLSDLSQFGCLRVAGEDAGGFLHNLLSSDVHALSPQRALYSSLNSAKGRVLANLLIWRDTDDYFLQLPHSLLAAVHKKLSMYVLRSRVRLADVSADCVCLGVSGPQAETLLQTHFPGLPSQPLDVVLQADMNLIRLGAERFQINLSAALAPALWQQLSGAARPVGAPCWDWLGIRAGIPVVLPQTQEAFVAQMANLDLIGAVNFRKGCYPGQEIVARMQYLGKLKRRMYLAHIDAAAAPAPGTELYSVEMEGQACGTVVNAQPAPAGGCDLLAVIQIASHDAFPVHLGALDGPRLHFQALPYPLP